MSSLRICLLASEASPFAKTGGLADVMTGLGRYLAQPPQGQAHDVRLFLPYYRKIREEGVESSVLEGGEDRQLRMGTREITYSLRLANLPASPAQLYLVDCPELYDREALYTNDADEALRFAFLTRAVLETCQLTQWAPDIIHCNDWHTALLPLYLETLYAWDELFANTKTLLTIHNIGYQGVFADSVLDQIGLGEQRAHVHHGDLREGRINFLKTGVMHSDVVSTVSRTYAKEIQTAEQGMGLEAVLQARPDEVVGIVNGVDYTDWDPATDPLIPHHFTADDLSGKARMKEALLGRMGLPHDPSALTFGVVSRLTAQKGFELFSDSIPVILQREDVRLCVLGSGDADNEQYFQWLRDTWPQKVAIYRGYSNELAHWIEAGCDVFLMPSRYEPCGLNQMYSLRYGTPPVVRRTGGLADTVEAWNPATGTGTGFLFDDFTNNALLATLEWLLQNWQNQDGWRQLMRNGMAQDFSWARQGPHYETLYRSLLAPRSPESPSV
ncbi:MAG: glycogen synthase [Planctomycetota bacterium]|nr:glycogen synthase [Planctomycetota bacterium]